MNPNIKNADKNLLKSSVFKIFLGSLFVTFFFSILFANFILPKKDLTVEKSNAASTNPDSDFEFGVNYTHYQVAGNASTAADLSLGPILFKYHETGIREKVQSQMLTMRNNGIQRIRMLMWFMDAYTNETWGILPSSTGKLIEPYRTNYINFLTDLKNYGFSTFYIGFGPSWTNDTDITKFSNENWSYIDDAISLAKAYGPKKIQVDLHNELAISPGWGTDAYNNAIAYVKDIWPKYVAKYGAQDGTFSLHAKSIAPAQDPNLENRLIDTIRSINQPLPGFYDIHIYTYSSSTAFSDIQSAIQSIRGKGVNSPLGIGEMYYNSQAIATGINNWMIQNPGTIKFAEPWMLQGNGPTSSNDIAVNPPFTDSNLINTIGYKNTYGYISCNPSIISIASNTTTNATIISSWSNINGSTTTNNYTSEVCVNVNNTSNTLMSRYGGITGAQIANPGWITSNNNYQFTLYDTNGNLNLNCSGTILSQCSITTSTLNNTPTLTPTKTLTPTPTFTPVPTTIASTTSSVSCLCQSNNLCSTSCSFSNGLSNSGLSCSNDSIYSSSPTQSDKNSYCTRELRTLGDANGDGVIAPLDYIYYVRAVNGGAIPPNINTDFNGDGATSVSDRTIVIANVQN